MFADDCLIFGTASPTAAKNILRTLNDFSNVSGEHISYHKSTLYFSGNVTGGIRTNISQTLGIQHKSTIGRYLGIHNVVFWKDAVNTNDLILRMQKKLAGWKANTLSRGGKLTLIKANLTGMPNHVLSCFKCPSKISFRLDIGHFIGVMK